MSDVIVQRIMQLITNIDSGLWEFDVGSPFIVSTHDSTIINTIITRELFNQLVQEIQKNQIFNFKVINSEKLVIERSNL